MNLKLDDKAYAPYLSEKAELVLRSIDGTMAQFGGIELNGAYRTPEYNKVVEGVSNSLHMSGNAFDLAPNEHLLKVIVNMGAKVRDTSEGTKYTLANYTILDEGDHLHFEVF